MTLNFILLWLMFPFQSSVIALSGAYSLVSSNLQPENSDFSVWYEEV